MRIESERVGAAEVPEERLLRFPSGLVGFPRMCSFALLELGSSLPLAWLQSTEHRAFGFPVAEAALFLPDQHLEIPAGELEEIGLRSVGEARILVVTTVRAAGLVVTGNLRAPLVIDPRSRRGRQIVLERSDLDLRAPADAVVFGHGPAAITGGAIEPDSVSTVGT